MTKHQILILNKAVRALHEKGHSFIGGIHCNSVARLLVEMEQEIKSLKAAQPKWISVEERLPEHNSLVLVHGPKGGICVARCSVIKNIHDVDCPIWTVVRAGKTMKATHWMPLPESPKVDEHE